MPRLAERYTVIAPDLLGHGRSAKPRGDYSLGAYAAGVRDLLAVLGFERGTVVGHSLGGGHRDAVLLPLPRVRRADGADLAPAASGREVHPLLRAATLPGSEWVLPLMAREWSVQRRRGGALGRRPSSGSRPGPTWPSSPAATPRWSSRGPATPSSHTMRSVIDPDGQRVCALDRLYLADQMPTLIIWGDRRPGDPGRARPQRPRDRRAQPLRRDRGLGPLADARRAGPRRPRADRASSRRPSPSSGRWRRCASACSAGPIRARGQRRREARDDPPACSGRREPRPRAAPRPARRSSPRAGAVVVTILLLGPILLYKAGPLPAARPARRPSPSASPASPAGRRCRAPSSAITLLIAVFGMYWDISLHIDDGRDPGPLANPAHYFILAGLFGVFTRRACSASRCPTGRPAPRSRSRPAGTRRSARSMIAICGAVSLSAFPLDDVWHRIFGQDVTLWGPTHLMLIGGASLSVLGAWALHVEGDEERPRRQGRPLCRRWTRVRELVLAGAFLVGALHLPGRVRLQRAAVLAACCSRSLIMLAAGIAPGRPRGSASAPAARSAAVLVYVAIRGTAGPAGRAASSARPSRTFPLYLVEALVVEGVALLWLRGRSAAERPITFGALAGLGIGTIGLAGRVGPGTRSGWSTSGSGLALPRGRDPRPPRRARRRRDRRLRRPRAHPGRSTRTRADAAPRGPARRGRGRGRRDRLLDPGQRRARRPRDLRPERAEHAGRPSRHGHRPARPARRGRRRLLVQRPAGRAATGRSHVSQLDEIGPGTYRITEPIPVDGTWKTTLRLHKGRELAGLPIFLPDGPGDPGRARCRSSSTARATSSSTRRTSSASRSTTSPGWLTLAAYLGVGLISLALIFVVGWGLARLEKRGGGPPDESAEPAGVGPAKQVEEGPKPRTRPATA